MSFDYEADTDNFVKIKVIGVGGAGGNVVKRMAESGSNKVEFVAVNTDKQALKSTTATIKLQIGEKLTGGKGAGAKPEVGRKAAEENRSQISEILQKTDMVFVTAGMGGGTGTGAAPVVAQIAKEMGILTVGVVTRPFRYEGPVREKFADEGIRELSAHVDSLVVIPNDRIKATFPPDERVTWSVAITKADEILQDAVTAISDLIQDSGNINLDFADVCTIMRDAGRTHMGFGEGTGKDRALQAAQAAVSSPLMEQTLDGAKGLLMSIIAPNDMEFDEPEVVCDYVRKMADAENVNLIYGLDIREELEDVLRVIVIATGFEEKDTVGAETLTKLPPQQSPLPNSLSGMEASVAPAAPVPVQPSVPQQPFHNFDPVSGVQPSVPVSPPVTPQTMAVEAVAPVATMPMAATITVEPTAVPPVATPVMPPIATPVTPPVATPVGGSIPVEQNIVVEAAPIPMAIVPPQPLSAPVAAPQPISTQASVGDYGMNVPPLVPNVAVTYPISPAQHEMYKAPEPESLSGSNLGGSGLGSSSFGGSGLGSSSFSGSSNSTISSGDESFKDIAKVFADQD